MKAYQKGLFALSVIFIVFQSPLPGQLSKPYELGAGAGISVYQGDLSPFRLGSFRTMKPGLYLQGTQLLTPVISVRANLTFSKLKGDESKFDNPEYRQQRNFKFTSPLIEASALLVWDIRGKNFTDRYKTFSPYVFAGAGISYLNVKRDWSAMNTELFDAGSETQAGLNTDMQRNPPRLLPVIPAGLGIRYDFSRRFAVSMETSYRITFSDYIDGFSKAANPERNDHYHSTSLGLIYKPGKKNAQDCPVISRY